MMLYYYDHPIEYEPSVDDPFDGRLILDDVKRELLQRLEDENDGWYLDDDGERWPAEELFSRSPWRWESPAGTVKLLQRFLNYADGRTWFSTPTTYGGELFRWLRDPQEDKA